MKSARRPITLQGKKHLETELTRLMEKERPKVVQAIKVARAHGDLSENADYSAAKERQGHIEGRIAEIGSILSRADVIDTSGLKSEKILFGAYVQLLDADEDQEKLWQIVGEDEANVGKGKISIKSPLARKLIGKKKGDEFEFQNVKGKKTYLIQDVYFK